MAVRLALLNAQNTLAAQDRLTNIGSRPAQSRVAHLLLDLCSRLKPQGALSNGQEIDIPLAQHDIADALGLTSVYVSQTLKCLREKELLLFKNGRLQILNPSGLVKIADFDKIFAI